MRRVPLVSLFVTLYLALAAVLAHAQAAEALRRAGASRVSGIVYDSIAGRPLADAIVQLVPPDPSTGPARTAQSDALGRFTFDGVPEGRYMIGFIHPVLDSLGLEPPVRDVYVRGPEPAHADLAVPSATRLRRAVCGGERSDSLGMIVGVVRDARDGSTARGDTVIGQWLEFSFRATGLVRLAPRLVATTAANGWFAMCNVPRGGTMSLVASRGRDSTDLLDVDIPADGFLRRDLYVGPSKPAIVVDSSRRGDSLAKSHPRHEGDGQVSGIVVTAVGGRPLDGAHVGLAGGPEAQANDRGEWTLTHAPLGTRVLEVRAVGYYPVRRVVDIIGQGPEGTPTVRVALSTLKAVLDTVRVTAARLGDRHHSEFESRRRSSGTGRFLTPQDIARRNAMLVSDLLRTMPGLRVDYDAERNGRTIMMRGAFGECSPALFLDGMYVPSFGALVIDDIDLWLKPDDVAGIEVYTEPPPQFQRGLSGCGSIVIWSK
jgi:Carboxypeptidase regulatory-like domain/TonB-dependent Receptor Plug Domain